MNFTFHDMCAKLSKSDPETSRKCGEMCEISEILGSLGRPISVRVAYTAIALVVVW